MPIDNNKMTDKKQLPPPKVKEFEWYEIETKVRELMSDILTPFNRKQTQESLKLIQLKRNLEKAVKRVDDHDFLLERESPQKPTYIELQDQKLKKMEEEIGQWRVESQGRIKGMEKIVQIYEGKVQQINQLELRLDNEVKTRIAEFTDQQQHFSSLSSLLQQKQESVIKETSTLTAAIRANVHKLQSRMVVFQNRMKELDEELRRKGLQLVRTGDQVGRHGQKLGRLENRMQIVQKESEEREKDARLSQKFFAKVKDVQGDLKFLQTYLECYQPLYNQMQLSQTLHSFIQGPSRRRLCLYEQIQYAKFHQHILMTNSPSLPTLMSNYSNSIRKILTRNKKYTIHLAVTQSIKYGTNLYEFRLDDIKDDEQKKGKVEIVVPEDQIRRVVAETMVGVKDQVKSIVNLEIKELNGWVKEIQQQMLLRSLDFDKKFNQLLKKAHQVESTQLLQEKHLTSQINQHSNHLTHLQSNMTVISSHIKDLLNFSSVINHIVIQDQIDRQGTALYALKSTAKSAEGPPPTIQLDPNCLNCEKSVASPSIVQAFKMACITYNPSQIRIDDQMFTRQEILEVSTNILEKVKKRIEGRADQNDKQRGKVIQIKKKSFSAIKDVELRDKSQNKHRNSDRKSGDMHRNSQIQMQTLLPILSSSRNMHRDQTKQKQRITQFSVFY